MSVLIKGMEMPKNGSILRCTICVAPNRPGSIAINSGHGKPYSEFYELAEVPTPHGRLIDADTINYPLGWQGEIVKAVIDESPTIIEAEVR